MIKRFSDKVKASFNKFGVNSLHVIRCFHLHYAMFCLANVNVNTLPAHFTVSEESVFPKKACSDVSRFI